MAVRNTQQAPRADIHGNDKIDVFRQGYPRFAALTSVHPAFHICRRYARLRMRLLLKKQDEISRLEEALDKVDRDEINPLFLGSVRRDKNQARQDILRTVEQALADYDKLVGDIRNAFLLPTASKLDISSLKNWVEGNSSIARVESTFLDHEDDLLNLLCTRDNALSQLDTIIETCVVWIGEHLSIRQLRKYTDDPHVFIFGQWISWVSRTVITCVATGMLLAPIFLMSISCNAVMRLATVALATGFFVFVVSIVAKSGTVEVLASGAAYAAVLVSSFANNDGTCG